MFRLSGNHIPPPPDSDNPRQKHSGGCGGGGLERLSLDELKTELEMRGLSANGTRWQRIDRLQRANLEQDDRPRVAGRGGKVSDLRDSHLQTSALRGAGLVKTSKCVDFVNQLEVKREMRRKEIAELRQQRVEEEREMEAKGLPADVDFHRMIKKYRETYMSPGEEGYKVIKDLRIAVAVRKRPVLEHEEIVRGGERGGSGKPPLNEVKYKNFGQKRELDTVTVLPPNRFVVHDCKFKVDGLSKYLDNYTFEFDLTFGEESSTGQVCKHTAVPLLDYVLRGAFEYQNRLIRDGDHNSLSNPPKKKRGRTEVHQATVFAYGQTGSGKTYTMVGLQEKLCSQLFRILKGDDAAPEEKKSKRDYRLSVGVQFFEIYGSKVYDLLNPQGKLALLEDASKDIHLPGLTEKRVEEEGELWDTIKTGNNNRSTAATAVNPDSSRSHAICSLLIRSERVPSDEESLGSHGTLVGKLTLVDLAGSERAQDTSCHAQPRRAEGAEINKSLLALKECIRAMDGPLPGRASPISHIPFRASKLTMVLRDAFTSEKSRMVMIACICPGMSSANHSVNTLKYSDRLKGKHSKDPVPYSCKPCPGGTPMRKKPTRDRQGTGEKPSAKVTFSGPPLVRPDQESHGGLRSRNQGHMGRDQRVPIIPSLPLHLAHTTQPFMTSLTERSTRLASAETGGSEAHPRTAHHHVPAPYSTYGSQTARPHHTSLGGPCRGHMQTGTLSSRVGSKASPRRPERVCGHPESSLAAARRDRQERRHKSIGTALSSSKAPEGRNLSFQPDQRTSLQASRDARFKGVRDCPPESSRPQNPPKAFTEKLRVRAEALLGIPARHAVRKSAEALKEEMELTERQCEVLETMHTQEEPQAHMAAFISIVEEKARFYKSLHLTLTREQEGTTLSSHHVDLPAEKDSLDEAQPSSPKSGILTMNSVHL